MAQADLPAYRLIYEAILKKIRKGQYPAGTAIPSENELARKYQVSRMTARKSVDMLVAEGYLFRQKGRGTFPTGHAGQIRDDCSLTDRMADRDRRIYTKVLSFKTSASEKFGAGPDSPPVTCWRIERIRFVDDLPAVYEQVWIPVAQADVMTAEDARGSLTEFLSRTGDLGPFILNVMPCPKVKKKVSAALKTKKKEALLIVEGQLQRSDGSACLKSRSWQNPRVLPLEILMTR